RRLEQPTRNSRGLSRLAAARATPHPCLALHRVGFTLPALLPEARWALTPPFHPCLCPKSGHRRSALCGTFRRLAAPGRYPAPCPVELGLSSTDHPRRDAGRDPHSLPIVSKS